MMGAPLHADVGYFLSIRPLLYVTNVGIGKQYGLARGCTAESQAREEATQFQ